MYDDDDDDDDATDDHNKSRCLNNNNNNDNNVIPNCTATLGRKVALLCLFLLSQKSIRIPCLPTCSV